MKITCSQMDVLISFYLDGELSKTLKSQVEEHLATCAHCSAKFDILESMLADIKNSARITEDGSFSTEYKTNIHNSKASEQYLSFKKDLSAYIDNELENNESIKIKKLTISNPIARKELENSYNIRRLLNNSFKKTKDETKQDFARNIIRQLEIDEKNALNFHPAIKLLIVFTISVLVLSTIVLVSLSI